MKPLHKTNWFTILSLVLLVHLFGQVRCPAPVFEIGPASPAEVNAGTVGNKFVSPATAASRVGQNLGTFTETNTIVVGVRGLNIGLNTDNSFLTAGSVGNETLVQRLPNAGWWGVDANNLALIWKLGRTSAGASPDMAWNFLSPLTTTYQDFNHFAYGAAQSISVPYIAASASSLIDLPTRGPEIWAAKKHPWLGFHTDIEGINLFADRRGWQRIFTNLPLVCKWFNTNGIVSAVGAYGMQVGIWGDAGWGTNRSAVSLRFDPFILTASGQASASNYVSAVHTNGLKLSLAIYRDTTPVNAWNGDTERVQTNPSINSISFPSQLGSWTGPVDSAITPETIEKDVLWFYTNCVDEIFLQNNNMAMYGGYEQQVFKFAYATLYLGANSHLYWANNQNTTGQAAISAVPGTFPRAPTAFPNQLILGWFDDFPGSQLQYSISDISPNQGFVRVGSEPGLALAMALARTYHESMSNWDNPVFPSFPESTELNDQSLAKLSITNFLAVGEMFRGNIYFEIDTNGWSWNTNIQQVVTNAPLYMATWQDNTLKWPRRVFDDGTNSAWVRPIDGGNFLTLFANQSAGSSNFLVNLPGNGNFPTNFLWNVTNVLTGAAISGGTMTNTLAFTVPSGNALYARLTPARTAITNAGVVYFLSPIQTQ